MKSFRLGILFLLTLSGCTVGPNYQQPEVALPSSFSETNPLTEEEEVELRSWWTQFDDPQLNVLIHEAIVENLDFRRAIEKINQVRAEYQIKAAELAPKVDMTLEERRSRISQNLFDSPFLGPPLQNFYKVGFDASWELDIFGKRRRDKEAAFYTYEAERENARDVYITLLSEVASGYIEMRSLQHQIQKTKKQIYLNQELLSLTDSRLEAGLSSEIDVQSVRSLLELSRASLPPLESQLQQVIHGLAVLVGKPPEEFGEALKREAPIPLSTKVIPTGLPSELLRRRPDIRRAERELAAATANVGSAIADLFPRFSLIGDFGLASNRSNNWFKAQSRMWSIGPSMDWPLFYFGRIRENIRAQTSVQQQALLSYEQTILTALEDVENSLIGYYKEDERRERLEKEVETKRRIYTLKKDLYLSGLADFQTFLQADEDLTASETELISSTQTLSTQLVALYKALGGEW